MADHPRRRFLKASAGVVSGLALGGCAEEQAPAPEPLDVLDRSALDAVARLVMPVTALGETGLKRAVDDFLAWLVAFDPVAELDHPYDASDIRYGPPDPAPLWRAQLEALDFESGKRFHTRFATLDEKQQREILGHQLPEQIPADMPYAGSATHVAIGLLAWFYATSEANDLAHEAKIGRETCRGLASGAEKPAPLES